MNTALTMVALGMAIPKQKPGPRVSHHSGQGGNYASREYVEELRNYGFNQLGREGKPTRMP
jgi:transposase InsO family protein